MSCGRDELGAEFMVGISEAWMRSAEASSVSRLRSVEKQRRASVTKIIVVTRMTRWLRRMSGARR